MLSILAHIRPTAALIPLVSFAVQPVSQVPLCPKGSPEAHQGCRLAWSLKWGSMRWPGQHFWYCSLEWLTAWIQSQVDEDYSLLPSADQNSPHSKTWVSNCHLCRLQGSQTCSRAHYHHLGSYKSPCGGTPRCWRRTKRDALASLPHLLSEWLPPAGGTSAFHTLSRNSSSLHRKQSLCGWSPGWRLPGFEPSNNFASQQPLVWAKMCVCHSHGAWKPPRTFQVKESSKKSVKERHLCPQTHRHLLLNEIKGEVGFLCTFNTRAQIPPRLAPDAQK